MRFVVSLYDEWDELIGEKVFIIAGEYEEAEEQAKLLATELLEENSASYFQVAMEH